MIKSKPVIIVISYRYLETLMTTKMEKANVWDANANISLAYCIHSIKTKSTIYYESWDWKIEIHTEFRS